MGLSRRSALKLAGGAAASALLPFLPVGVRAAESAAPKRLLVVFSPMGYLESSFWPRQTSDGGFTLGETMTALNDFKSQLIYPDGLILYGASWYFPDDDNEHGSGMAMAFTASKKAEYATGPSIDQVVADHSFAQAPRRFRSLALGVNAPSPSGHTSCFFSGAQKPVNAQNNPSAAFDSLFHGLQLDSSDASTLERVRRQKQSVIDLVRAELNSACSRIGAQEQEKCAAHLEALRRMETRLQAGGVTSCSKPEPKAGGDLAHTVERQMDLISAAFTCDLTRVATLQLGFCDGGLDMLPGINHHDTTHAVGDTKGAAGPVNDHKAIDRWFADRWAYLLGRLAEVRESNGSLLDNTLVLFGSDTTTNTSYDAWGAHQHWRFPYWLAGGGNFAFRTGRHLNYAHPQKPDGNQSEAAQWQPASRLFVSICRAFGIETDTFGNMDPGSGPLANL